MRVLLIGGTGLVGRALAERAHARGCDLTLLLRRPPATPLAGARLFVNASLGVALDSWQVGAPACDVFVSALGTTRRVAGSAEGFARVDRDLVLSVASAARAAGARQAVIVSSVGADSRARNTYLRVKGEIEERIQALGFQRCDFLQPGLLLGSREQQPERLAERFGQHLAPLLNPWLIGGLSRFRAIPAEDVATAAAALVGRAPAGVFRHHFAALKALGGQIGEG